ncbi:hypothetical protein IB238_00680 [Rhizobium sp. ARZ01]|uniref:hypothetical protein n=1 Tax=Rhizobium sp. ARZ01 TaxID=2769313 RepID=UPI001786EE1F|nr:hypothetical protein [Rhizobium sp. ARZ01]
MLYKSLISMYGSSLSGKSTPNDDIVWHFAPSEHLRYFREYALDALQQAKVYLLDHLAAAYADTLHEAFTEEADEPRLPALAILGEVKLPSKVAWVEFDDQALGKARFERASPVTRFEDKPSATGQRGYLLDDRNEGYLRVTMFHKREGRGVVDPICALLVERTAAGTLNYDDIEVELSRSMFEFHMRSGVSPETIHGMRTVHQVETGYDLFIPYALFAMLVSPDLGGIIPTETETFTTKDWKTARKFGKLWLFGAQKSHLTIRIGPQAAAHMAERTARLEFQRQAIEARNGPVRHWVAAHERHYRSGKVVLVKGHHRGHQAARELPTRVMGPRLDVTRFEFPATKPQNHKNHK